MPSTFFFVLATSLLSLNFVRPYGLSISDWLYFCALGFAFLETFLIARQYVSCWWRNRFLWAVMLILFGAIISTMNSRNWGIALVEIFQQIFVMTLFLSLAWIMVRRGKMSSVILALIFSGVFTAGIVLVDYITGLRLGPELSGTPDIQLWGRFAGTLGHPNKLGYFLVLTTLLSIGQLLNVKMEYATFLNRMMWSALIIFQVFGIYLSGSMTAYLGLLTGIIVLFFSSRPLTTITTKGKVTKKMGIFLWGGILVVLIALFIFSTQIMLTNKLPNFGNNVIVQALNRVRTSTAESRFNIYAQAWRQIIESPWFGVGYDQISTSGVSSSSRLLDFTVHNSLLQIWYAGGIFAFIGWVAIYISIFLLAISVIRKGIHVTISPLVFSIAATTMAILIMDQFQDAIYQREKWLVIGLLVGYAWDNVEKKLFLHRYV